MHRLILGDPPSETIDHWNRNKLDNRRKNLIPCTYSQKAKNVPMMANKSSRYRGVMRYRGKWQVVVRVNGQLKWLGCFHCEDEAGKVAAPYFAAIPA